MTENTTENLQFAHRIGAAVSAYIRSLQTRTQGVVWRALDILLGESASRYDFHGECKAIPLAKLQKELTAIRPAAVGRRKIFHMPDDVRGYLIGNTLRMAVASKQNAVFDGEEALRQISALPARKLKALLLKKKFFDPVCGEGEIPLAVFRTKFLLLVRSGLPYGDKEICTMAASIGGSDPDDRYVDRLKLLLFFEACKHLRGDTYYDAVAAALRAQITVDDFIFPDKHRKRQYDCVLSYPPFRSNRKPKSEYGNAFADILRSAMAVLKRGGACGWILPKVYLSNQRIAPLRAYMARNMRVQWIVPFARYPECLIYNDPNAKNLLFARKGHIIHALYTASYRRWESSARKEALGYCALYRNRIRTTQCIPKVGNATEESLYRKVTEPSARTVWSAQQEDGTPLYLRLGNRFWIKTYATPPPGLICRTLRYGKELPLVHCLLRSSLFWFYHIVDSANRHVSDKSLQVFALPVVSDEQLAVFDALLRDSQEVLAKWYAPDPDTDYPALLKAYKQQTDRMDDALAKLYGLTDEETAYVKAYALPFRLQTVGEEKFS